MPQGSLNIYSTFRTYVCATLREHGWMDTYVGSFNILACRNMFTFVFTLFCYGIWATKANRVQLKIQNLIIAPGIQKHICKLKYVN